MNNWPKYVVFKCSGTMEGLMSERADSMGMRVSEYLKYLAAKDFAENCKKSAAK